MQSLLWSEALRLFTSNFLGRCLLFPKPPRQGGMRGVLHLDVDRGVASRHLSHTGHVVQES